MINKDDFDYGSKVVWCNTCRRQTNHVRKGRHSWSHHDEDERGEPTGWWEDRTSELLICAGCETAVLMVTHDSAAHHGYESSTLFPKRESDQLVVKVFKRLPPKITKIYGESVRAFNSDCLILCSMGLRAAIEGICNDKGLTGDNLYAKIDALATLMPVNIVNNLHGFRFMGNDAAHELEAPDRDDIKIAIEVCEDLMSYLYELDYKSSLLVRKKKHGGGAL